jgi:hypothetical protein
VSFKAVAEWLLLLLLLFDVVAVAFVEGVRSRYNEVCSLTLFLWPFALLRDDMFLHTYRIPVGDSEDRIS